MRNAVLAFMAATLLLGASPQATLSVTVQAAPTPAPTPTPAPGNVATLDGCNMYTAGDYFNETGVALDSQSTTRIASYVAAPLGGLSLQIQTSWHVNVTASPTYYTDHSTSGHAPIASGFPWATGFVVSEHNSDDHGETLVTAGAPNGCTAYGGYWGNGNDNINNSTQNITFYASQLSHLGGTLAASNYNSNNANLDMAGGIPVIPGMLVYSQFAATGAWNHALVIVVGANATCTGTERAPAVGNGGLSYNGPGGDASVCLPYGAHIRLKSSYSTAGFSAQNLAIANTLKTYGAFINDTAGSALKIPADDDSRWGSTSQLGNITMSNFDVLAN